MTKKKDQETITIKKSDLWKYSTFVLLAVALIGGFLSIKGFSSSSVEGLVISEPGYKEFEITLENNEYHPSYIEVDQGDEVVLRVTNFDGVAHGLALPQFNAFAPNGHVFPGQTVELRFVASEIGVADAATCGGSGQPGDLHGEKLIINVR